MLSLFFIVYTIVRSTILLMVVVFFKFVTLNASYSKIFILEMLSLHFSHCISFVNISEENRVLIRLFIYIKNELSI